MLRDITIGQHFPGDSLVHKFDPRMKLVLTIVYIILLFAASNPLGLTLSLVFLVAMYGVAKIPFKLITKSLKPILPIILFTAVLNLFFVSGEGEPLVHFWVLNIYAEGLRYAILMAVRVMALIAGTSLLTYTTSPIVLTDAIEQLLKPLGRLHFPVHELAMMMSIALRFIPTLIEETDKIMNAQKARGAMLDNGSMMERVKALVPVLIPLFISAFRRADELAMAMELSLIHIFANEMGVQIRITSGPAIEKPGDLAALLTNLQEGDVLFIDEIHRLSRQVEEVLYPALEDYALDIMIGKGPSAQSIRINLPRFTLVGATTRAGQITGPLRDRFGVLLKLELYSPDELSRIIQRSAGILDQPITPEGAYELAKCSRGTPRVANRFLKRVRDFATVLGDGIIDRDVSLMSLKRMDVDALGLDELDRSLLRAIIEMYNGGPVGLETLAAALGEEAVTLEDLCEPYLMQMGFLTRTPRGRCATRLAYEHLGLKAPETGSPEDNGQQSLF